MVVVREGIDQMDTFNIRRALPISENGHLEMTIKTRGPVGARMVRFSGSTDQMNNFDIQ